MSQWREKFSFLRELVADNQILREVLLGSSLGLIIKVLATAIAFLMSIVIARKLGPEEAGLFFLGLTLVTLLATVGRMGLDSSLMRFVAKAQSAGEKEKLRGVYRKAILWGGGLCMLVMLVLLISSQWLSGYLFRQPGFGSVLPVMAMALPFVGLYNLHVYALLGMKRVAGGMVILTALVPSIMLLGLLVFSLTTAQEASWLYFAASGMTLMSGFLLWRVVAPVTDYVEPFPSDVLRASCMPLWGVAVLGQTTQWSSQLLMGVWHSAEDIALLAVAQRTALLIGFVKIAVTAVTGSKYASLFSQGDLDGVHRVALWSMRLILLVAVPVLMFMLLFPGWLMGLFGPQFREASIALVVLAIGQFIYTSVGSVESLLSMTGHERQLRNNVLIGAMLGVGFGLLLIPNFGLLGAAIATAIAMAVQNLLCVYQVKKLLGFNALAVWRKV